MSKTSLVPTPKTAVRRKARAGASSPAASIDRALELIDKWLAEDPSYEEETWEELKAALDEDRLSSRPLFPG
jgi:hypothetical protein